MIHDELLVQFCTTEDDIEAQEILLLLVNQYMQLYYNERAAFAERSGIPLELVMDEGVQGEYALYIADLFTGMRERAEQKRLALEADREMQEKERRLALYAFIAVAYQTIDETESSNARQLSQLQVAETAQQQNGAVRITKTWRAHPDCCEVCSQLDGTTIPIDEHFLVNGQVVELGDGTEFIYNYIDRGVAICHPNDRCWIEFNIEY